MIKLYFGSITDFTEADYTKQYSLLDCALKQKIDRKKATTDKMRSLCGLILFYRGINELYQKDTAEISFGDNGKPLCDFCYFNISHSEDRAVCAFSDKPIGVDIQKIVPIKKRKKYKFFNQSENDYVNSDDNLFFERYTEIFTKKESAIKMLGLSLKDASFIDTFSGEFVFQTQKDNDFITTVCTKKL